MSFFKWISDHSLEYCQKEGGSGQKLELLEEESGNHHNNRYVTIATDAQL